MLKIMCIFYSENYTWHCSVNFNSDERHPKPPRKRGDDDDEEDEVEDLNDSNYDEVNSQYNNY